MSTSSSSFSPSPPSTPSPPSPALFPRGGVSVVVRSPISHKPSSSSSSSSQPSFVLVQRGKEPNKGLWSLPGGKVELGETTLAGAKRELREETGLVDNDSVQFYPGGAFRVTDSIHRSTQMDSSSSSSSSTTTVQFHYMIAQCFATAEREVPIVASDDAADARWMTLGEIQNLLLPEGRTTPGVVRVIEHAEALYQAGFLQTGMAAASDEEEGGTGD